MLMIDPLESFASTNRCAAARATLAAPMRFVSSTRRHSPSSLSSIRLVAATPALLTMIWTGPISCHACSKAASMDASDVTSILTISARPPPASISCLKAWSCSTLRAARITFAPAPESVFAKLRPRPDDAPVTSAVFPDRSKLAIVAPPEHDWVCVERLYDWNGGVSILLPRVFAISARWTV